MKKRLHVIRLHQVREAKIQLHHILSFLNAKFNAKEQR